MTEYQYRVVYREKGSDLPWINYISNSNPMGRPYTTLRGVKTIVAQGNNSNDNFEYKAQRFPLTQEWEDI